jgi:uncharacterized protein YceK
VGLVLAKELKDSDFRLGFHLAPVVLPEGKEARAVSNTFWGGIVMRLTVVLVLVLILSGCSGLITKWECAGSSPCIDRDRAVNKCLAQANTALSRKKSTIWEQCMRGEGFAKIPCAPGEHRTNKDCQLLHVW